MEIIGFSGWARSGKDTAASLLAEELGFIKVAFADKLREALYTLNPIIVANAEHHGMVPTTYSGSVYLRLQDVIDVYGWEGYKKSPFSDDIRNMIQRLGTDVGRNILGENTWVDATLKPLENMDIVVSDVRFPNEAQAILDRGGKVFRITRKGVKPANSHLSETSLDNWRFDAYIDNNGTVDDLKRAVLAAYHATR